MTNDESSRPELSIAGRRRFFIVCAGRTGSSLLAVILGDAGANFGMQVPENWNRNAGTLEIPESQKAAYHYNNANRISPDKPTTSAYDKLRWSLQRHRGKKTLQKALTIADYIKCPGADLIVHPSFRLGYFPQVIINFRRFEDHARSFFQMHAYSSIEWIAERYHRVYRNGLVLLSLYGGCVVSYDELVDPSENNIWIDCLAQLTSLSRDRLAESHRRRLSSDAEPSGDMFFHDPAARDLYEAMNDLRGRVVPPSAQALRNWGTRWSG